MSDLQQLDVQTLAETYLQRRRALDDVERREPHTTLNPREMSQSQKSEWLAWHDEYKPLSAATRRAADELQRRVPEITSTHPMNLNPQAELLASGEIER